MLPSALECSPHLLLCVHCPTHVSLQHAVRLIAFGRLEDYLEVSVPVKLGGSGSDGKPPSPSDGTKRPPPDATPDEAPEEKRAKPQ